GQTVRVHAVAAREGDGAGPGNFSPSDRRMHLNSGPFVMAPGDTQEVIVAVYGGIGNDRLQSFANMKQNIENIKNLFGTPILIPGTSSYIQHPSQSTTELFVQADLRGFSNVVSCETNFIPESGSEPGFSLPLLDDGMHNDSLAGDGIWGNSIVQSNRKVPYNGGMVITTTSNQFDFPGIYSKVRLRPLPKLFNWRVTWENGRQDSSLNNNERIYLSFDLQNQDLLNDIDELEIINLQPSAYITNLEYNDVIPAGGIATNERFFLELIGPSQGDSLDYSYIVIIDGHRGEILSSKYPVVTWNPNPIWGDTLQVQSIVGTPDNVTPIVADPLLVNGHTYRIHFFEDTGTGEVLWRLIDYTTGSVKLDSLEMVTGPGFPHPVVDGIQWQVIVPPSTIKDWQYTSGIPSPLYPGYNDGRWFTGVNWGGGALSGGLGMSHIFWGAPPGVAPADFKTVEFRFTPITGYDDLDGNGEYTLGWGPNGEGEPYYFDTSQGQKAFMYHTWNTGTANYVGFHDIPFQVWDVEDPANPRQLNVVVRDRDQNTRWDIWHYDLPYNYVWVLADDYDPTGQAWDPANGPDHDFFAFLLSPTGASPSYYVLWAQQRGSRPFLAESGELTLTPYKHNGPGDILEVVSPPSLGIEDQTTPVTFYLQQNYPNPFNPETRIRFGVARKEKVALVIYNVLGQQVKKLVEREMSPGNHEIIWDGRNDAGNRVGSGIYFYRLIVGDQSPGAGKRFVQSRKMILLK
ncbi:MAG: FlgD immunoglobulin-like domain containing protein, partial [Calditrichia bacterium]